MIMLDVLDEVLAFYEAVVPCWNSQKSRNDVDIGDCPRNCQRSHWVLEIDPCLRHSAAPMPLKKVRA